MKEQYVTFKVAVHMKELGFNWPCGAYCRAPYDTLVKTEIDCTNADCDAQSQYEKNPDRDPSGNVFNIAGHEGSPMFMVPTQQMALRWLREEKGLHVDVIWDPASNTYGIRDNIRRGIATYEEAVDDGIKWAFSLIKE